MSNLFLRILSAVFLIPLILYVLFFAPPICFSVLVVSLAALAGFEYASISLSKASAAQRAFVALLSAVCAFSVAFSTTFPWAPLASLSLVPVASPVIFMFGRTDFKHLIQGTAHSAYGAIYSGALIGTIALLSVSHDNGRFWVLSLWACAILCDTAAYAAGRLFGRHKLAFRLSPGKTWEGAFGGLAGTTLAIVLSKLYLITDLSWPEVFALALPLSVALQIGDLAESFLKRGFGVKDSGKLIPGHGGLLDRIDSLIFGAPVVFLFSMFR